MNDFSTFNLAVLREMDTASLTLIVTVFPDLEHFAVVQLSLLPETSPTVLAVASVKRGLHEDDTKDTPTITPEFVLKSQDADADGGEAG